MDDSENEKEERGITENNSERMNTEEAIEFLVKEKLEECGLFKQYRWTISLCKLARNFDEVIKLLKRGEKFEKMWVFFIYQIEKLIEESYMVGLPCGDIKDIAIKKIHDLADELEQKYFPKEKY